MGLLLIGHAATDTFSRSGASTDPIGYFRIGLLEITVSSLIVTQTRRFLIPRDIRTMLKKGIQESTTSQMKISMTNW